MAVNVFLKRGTGLVPLSVAGYKLAGVLKTMNEAAFAKFVSTPPTTGPSDFVYGTTEPWYDNTGVPAGTVLTTMTKSNGAALGTWATFSSSGIEYFSPKAGVKITGMIIPWIVVVAVDGFIAENCRFTGPQGIAGGVNTSAAQNPEIGLVNFQSQNAKNGQLIRCEIAPTIPFSGSTGVIGHDYTADRCLVRACTDGFGVYNNNTGFKDGPVNVVIKGCLIIELTFMWGDPYHPNDAEPATHNDGIQWQGGIGLELWGNNFYMVHDDRWQNTRAGSGVDPRTGKTYRSMRGMVGTPNAGPIGNLWMHDNWFYYGDSACLWIPAANGLKAGTTLRLSNNRAMGGYDLETIAGVSARRGICYYPTMPAEGWPAGQVQGYNFIDTVNGTVDAAGNPARIWVVNS